MSEKLVDLSLHLHHMTDAALLLSQEGDNSRAVWVPKSVCEYEVKARSLIEVTMPEWLAIKKELV